MSDCNHVMIAILILGVAFLVIIDDRDGFRTQEEKILLATRLATPIAGSPAMKPNYDAMKTAGLDGAEFYEVRQLWNNHRFTKENIAKIL